MDIKLIDNSCNINYLETKDKIFSIIRNSNVSYNIIISCLKIIITEGIYNLNCSSIVRFVDKNLDLIEKELKSYEKDKWKFFLGILICKIREVMLHINIIREEFNNISFKIQKLLK